MNDQLRRQVRNRLTVVGVVGALLGLAIAVAGAGIWGFYIAGALTSPSALWISAPRRRHAERSRGPS